jgi:radical SAM protein with 4Fe4S-binding SPASM domain
MRLIRLIDRLVRRIRPARGRTPGARVARLEPFGAIVQLERPRALVFVDREYARSIGLSPPPGTPAAKRWRDPADDGAVGRSTLSAPLEAHLQLTNQCDAGCRGCYTGATPKAGAGEWGLESWRRAIDTLADMGVFHLALGGGESATLPWLGELAAHARDRGLIPNLTTSGLAGLSDLLDIAHLFGQINVSIDGLGAAYQAVRGFDGFARADRAVQALRARKREIGINTVITRQNFDHIGELFAYARTRRLNEIELLRFKPAGRGKRVFLEHTCTDEQHRALLPAVLRASKKHRMRVRLDCSYTPMIAHHRPDAELLAKLAVYGCTGGDFLIGAKADGTVTACSFAAPPAGRPKVHELERYWREQDAFKPFRDFRQADEPCRSCAYHELCRGGCRVVSAHVLGDARRPDPECPRVVDWQRARGQPAQSRLTNVRRSASLTTPGKRNT